MKRSLLVLIATVATSGPALGKGGDERDLRGDWLAAPAVRALVSATSAGALHRAVVLVEAARPTLVLEVTRGDAAPERRVVTHIQLGLSTLTLADVARDIDTLIVRDGRLVFDVLVEGARDPLRCTVALGSAALPVCQGTLPAQPRSVDRAAINDACARTFAGAEQASACRAQAARATHDPVATLAACRSHAYGDRATLECLTATAPAVTDPVPAVTACDEALFGQEGFLDCLRHAAAFRYGPLPTIRACDRAMQSDVTTLGCIAVASRFPFDAASTVAACDRATMSDESALACIRRGGAY